MFVILDGASLIHGTVQEMEITDVQGYIVQGFAFYSKNVVWKILKDAIACVGRG